MIEHFRTQLKARFDDNSHMFEDSEFGEYNPELEDDITEEEAEEKVYNLLQQEQ